MQDALLRELGYPCVCLVKRSQALLASNLTRDNQVEAGKQPAGPCRLRPTRPFFSPPRFFALSCLKNAPLIPNFHPQIWVKTPFLLGTGLTMKVFVINNYGAGFADTVEVPEGTTK